MQPSTDFADIRSDLRVRAQDAPRSGIQSISITMVKNEQDVIEPFLRTNRPYLDAMIVMDNGSVDATRSIAMDCARELGGIFVVDSPDTGYSQADQITAALRFTQSAFFADRVIFLDCDEFLSAKDPATFRAELAAEPAGTVTLHPWRTYLPDPQGGTSGSDPLDAIRFVRRKEKPVYKKVIWHLGGAFSEAMTVHKGAHTVRVGPHRVPSKNRPDLPVVHIPVRSADQVVAKAVNGWSSIVAEQPSLVNAGADYKGASHHRKHLLETVRERGLPLQPSTLADLANSYAQAGQTRIFQDSVNAERPSLAMTRRYSDGLAMPAEQAVFKTIIGRIPKDYSALLERRMPQRDISKPISATAFSDNWHWSHVFFDIAPFRYLAEYFQPETVLDVGCGKGIYLRIFEAFGAKEILGTDGIDPATTVLGDRQYVCHDLHEPLELGKTFDLVMCLEVIEHLDPAVTTLAFDSISRHAKNRIVFSVAEPGQAGHGHINCLPMDRVLDLWAERGWVPDLIETLGLRAISTMSWFRRNLLVLRKAGPSEDNVASAALRSIANLRYRWYGQSSGIRPAPFHEDYPTGNKAYGRVRSRKAASG
jgi:SAM-dependent methyltransferase